MRVRITGQSLRVAQIRRLTIPHGEHAKTAFNPNNLPPSLPPAGRPSSQFSAQPTQDRPERRWRDARLARWSAPDLSL